MNSLEISKCTNNGCINAKAKGDLAVTVLGLLILGIGTYCIYKEYEYRKTIALAKLNPILYTNYQIA